VWATPPPKPQPALLLPGATPLSPEGKLGLLIGVFFGTALVIGGLLEALSRPAGVPDDLQNVFLPGLGYGTGLLILPGAAAMFLARLAPADRRDLVRYGSFTVLAVATFLAFIGRAERVAAARQPAPKSDAIALWLRNLGPEPERLFLPPPPPKNPQPYVWKPAGSEFSVTFPGKPELEEKSIHEEGGDVTLLEATYGTKDGFLRGALITGIRSPKSREEAARMLTDCAQSFRLLRFTTDFSESAPSQAVGVINGSKNASTPSGYRSMRVDAEVHWGRNSTILLYSGGPVVKDKAPEAEAFVKSLRQDEVGAGK
jgi:hypothetical protein